jgi:hypothetical protein
LLRMVHERRRERVWPRFLSDRNISLAFCSQM